MPYIVFNKRQEFNQVLNELHKIRSSLDPGSMNYLITSIFSMYLKENGTNYERLNAIEGVLFCSAQEIYRRIIADYEDSKKDENGDVFR